MVHVGERRHPVHDQRVAVPERDGGNDDASRRVEVTGRPRSGRRRERSRGERDVHHGPGRRTRGPLARGQDAIDGDALPCRIGPEPPRGLHHVRQLLGGSELVDRGPHHRSGDLDAHAVHRREHDVAGLEPQVVPAVAPEQIVVQVERVHCLPKPPHFDVAHVGARGHAACRVQRGEHGAEGTDLVRPGLCHFADHVDLICAHVGDRDLEPDGGVRPTLHPGVHPSQARVQDIAQLVQRQVGDKHLAHLGEQHEPFARHLQSGGVLHVPREDQHQLVARPELVVRGYGAGEER